MQEPHLTPAPSGTVKGISFATSPFSTNQTDNMGTRHLVCVYRFGRFALAQYGRLDGYPEYAGFAILRFLTPANIARLLVGLQFTKFPERGKVVLHTQGAQVLTDVAEAGDTATTVEVGMNLEFANDTLYCEWAYVVDLDKGALEVYQSGDGPGVGQGRLAEAGFPY